MGTSPEQGLICGNGLCKQKLGGFSREHSDTIVSPMRMAQYFSGRTILPFGKHTKSY
jgi:hypothetical protein